MKQQNGWDSIESNWNNNDRGYVEKHHSSEKIIDFTNQLELNSVMRYDIINSLGIQIPTLNQTIFTVTTKAISLLDVINYVEQKIGAIEKGILFFYTINDKAAKYTCSLAKRCELKVIISDLMNSQRQKERVITQIFDESNVDIVFCHNHAKIAAIKIQDNYYVFSGSMNAGNNARIETLQITNSIDNYKFIETIFNKFKAEYQINKRY